MPRPFFGMELRLEKKMKDDHHNLFFKKNLEIIQHYNKPHTLCINQSINQVIAT